MSERKMTQWEYTIMLLPYDERMTEQELIAMPRQALSIWIERTVAKRRDAHQEENAELAREYKELIEEQKDKLLTVAQGMTTLKKAGYFEWKGPCPLCATGGHDRFHVNTRGVPWWYCRYCAEGGDTVSLVAKKNGLTMWEATEELAGWSPRERLIVNRQREYKKVISQGNKPKELADFAAKFGACRQTFRERSITGMAYFAKRGLDALTINKNRVGMIQTVRGMAIAYPCERLVDGAWQIVGINRRFLDAEQIKDMIGRAKTEEAQKKIRRDNPKTKLSHGGNWGVYRLRRIKGAIGLLVVEGEENSLSVFRIARANKWPCDVVSVGSQSNFKSLRDDLTKLANDYQHLLVWADEQGIADEVIDFYGAGSALAISSPYLAGYDKPADANAMLVAGELRDFLAHQLKRLSADLVPTMPIKTTPGPFLAPIGAKKGLGQALTNVAHQDVAMPIKANPNGQALTNVVNQPDVGTPIKASQLDVTMPIKANQPDVTLPNKSTTTNVAHQDVAKPIKANQPDVTLPNKPTTTNVAHQDEPDVVPSLDVSEIEDDSDSNVSLENVTISPWWAELPEQAQPEQPVTIITNDDFLGLCAELCDRLTDRQLAHEWYNHVENHYMYGDYTSLSEVHDAIYAAVTDGTPPVFPPLPRLRRRHQ